MNELYKYNLVTPDLYYESDPYFVTNDVLPSKEGFYSLYSITSAEVQGIISVGTTKGFKGSVWSERLWIDVDSYEHAEQVEQHLKRMNYDYVSYDSGGRGAHFGILRTAPPSHVLPSQDRKWVEGNFPKGWCDTSIYTHLHLFRLPGTKHKGTGRRKELVSSQSGTSIILPPYEKPLNNTNVVNNPSNASNSVCSIFNNFLVMSLTVPAASGARHASLVRLAFALRDSFVSVETAQWWLHETNKMYKEPKDVQEVDKIIRDIFSL